MDTIQTSNKFDTITPERVATSAGSTDVTLDSYVRDYYQGLTSNAFGVTTEAPATYGDVVDDYLFGSTLVNRREANTRMDIVEGLASSGKIPAEVAIDFYKQPYPSPYQSLERLQADNFMESALVEDVNSANDILDNPEKAEKGTRYNTNLGIVGSLLAEVRANQTSPTGYFLRGFLSGVDTARYLSFKSGIEAMPEDSYSALYLEFSRRMDTMEPEDFEAWLKGFVMYQHDVRGESWERIEDLLAKAYRPIDELPLSVAGDVADVAVLLGYLGKGIKIAATGAAATGQVVKTAVVKGAAKGIVKGALESVPLAPTAYKLIKGTLKTVKKAGVGVFNQITGRLAVGNLTGASLKLVDDVKAAALAKKAGVETAKKASKMVFDNIVEPFAKPYLSEYVQVGRTAPVTEGLFSTKEYYRVAQEEAARLGEQLLLPKIFNEAINEAWVPKQRMFDTSTNLAQISDMQPLISGKKVSARVLFGNSGEEAFTSFEQANKALKRFMKDASYEDVNASIIQSSPRSYYIQADVKLANSIGEIFRNYKGTEGTWKPKFFLGVRGSMPRRIEELREVAQRDSNFIRATMERYQKVMKGISKEDRAVVEMLKEIGKDGNAWFTPEYLKASGFSDGVVNGYMSARMIEDLGFAVKNTYTAKRLAEEGYQSIAFGEHSGVITGKIVSIDNADFKSRWISKGDGSELEKLTKEEFKKKYPGYSLIASNHASEGVNANSVYLIAPTDSIITTPLDKFFGSYVPGYRHFYDSETYFIKQPQFSTLPDGKKALADIKTIRGSTSLTDAQQYANELNEVRKVMNEYLSVPDTSRKWTSARKKANVSLQAMDNKYLNFSNVDDAIMFAEENGVDFLTPNAIVGVLKEGDDGSVFKNTLRNLDGDTEETFRKYIREYNWSSPSAIARLERGEGINDINTDAHLPWLDINGELNRVVREIEKYGTMEDYTRLFASDWAEQFKDVVDGSVDPVTALREGLINESGNSRLVLQAKYGKLMHDYIRGVPNSLDIATERWLGNFLSTLGEEHEWLKRIPGLGGAFKEGSRTFQFVSKMKAADVLRTWTAHWHLGCMRPKQLFTQALAVLQTLAISPRAGSKALPYSLVAPSLLFKNDDEAFELGVKILKTMGVTEANTKDLKQLVRNLELFDVYGQAAKGGALTDVAPISSKVSDASFLFFRMGEMRNRVHAPLTAMMELGVEFSDGSAWKPAQLSEMLFRSQNLYMNMGKTGISPAQMSALGKTLLQMHGFQMRGLEAITSGVLTPAEQRRLIAFGVLSSGIKGAVGTAIGYNVYNWMTEDFGVPEEVALPLYEGLLNTLAREVMDHPIDFSGYISPEYVGAAEDIYDIATQGPVQFMASSSVAGKTWNAIATTASAVSDWAFKESSTEGIKNLFNLLYAQKSLPDSLLELNSSLHILVARQKLSESGALVGKDLGVIDSVFNMFGFKTIDEVDYYEFLRRLGDDKEKVENAVKDALPVFMMAARDPNGFNINYFQGLFAQIADNYKLDIQQRAQAFREINRRAIPNLATDYKARLINGILKHKGTEKGKQELEARKIW